jgi:hypothetical protein
MSGTDGHYKPFQDVYGTVTSEKCRPSLQKRPARAKTLPYVASIQHARNTNIMMQCEECDEAYHVQAHCEREEGIEHGSW